ncbi:hypothetical protein BDV38DRAFT_235855 [Aspergillus pseudotamarii]|uniref:Uncharacterized protein n=1 Tax=Aspergillus pseudotamarii TaxID=132259 RepID=A0A5N6T6X8_ASPPS|nr:uncharacterized protein BDV38DRAFT_235855 [Aspergillus pseudotamarii]KAE8142108.1 hypothetical protein BDV38DRAFT_235855 [Aspergillus pseudotamarii]
MESFDSIRVNLYELDTPVEEEPPLYFNRRRFRISGTDVKSYGLRLLTVICQV